MERYSLEKRFSIPVGHRLSKHKGRCVNWHGHNFDILVCVASNNLNENDMIIDFKDLKIIVNNIIDEWDHSLLLNKDDPMIDILRISDYRLHIFDFDPTAEKMSEVLYTKINDSLPENIWLKYVTVYENKDSSVTYRGVHQKI